MQYEDDAGDSTEDQVKNGCIKTDHSDTDCNNNSVKVGSDKKTSEFCFKIPYDEWIKLPFFTTPSYKRLDGNWTDVFARYFNAVQPVCVLAFKYNRIARSTRAASFGTFSAKCKHTKCNAVYQMTIADKPILGEQIVVQVKRTGEISAENEDRSRFVKGCRRDQMKKDMESKSPLLYRSELLVDADYNQLNAGNLSAVPSKDVLKQVRAEERQYEKLSDCVVREVYAVKRTLEILDTVSSSVKGYIQFIGYEPFFIINFCAEQIDLLTEACQKGDAFLYFDATGLSMKRPMDQPKRMYMYCLVLQSRRHTESIRVAEMLTNDHTTPSILNFLMRIRHALTKGRRYKNPRKIETDFSFAMIHAACRAFNSCDLVTYLTRCWDTIENATTMPASLTVLHICAAHMLKIFQRMIVQSTEKSKKRKFWLYVLARLQTTSSLGTATSLIEDFTTVCRSTSLNNRAIKALDRLKAAVQMHENDTESEDTTMHQTSHEDQEGTLRMMSPFYDYFNQVVSNAYVSYDTGEENPFYNPKLVVKLVKDYLPFFPLWSGIHLSESRRNIHEGSSRDSNAVVERQFATVKHDVLRKERNINPGKACRLLYVSAKGLAKYAVVSSRKKKDKDDTQEEEKWQRLSQKDKVKKKKSIYFSSPTEKEFKNMSSTKKETEEKDASRESCDKRKDTKSKSTPKDSLQQRRKGKEPYLSDKMTKTQRVAECRPPTGRSLPPSFDFSDENAMKWGGFDKKKTGISLSNTCTIDNILTALYIIVCSRPDVLQELKKCTDTATQVVLEICLNEMVQRKWTEAKVKFVQDLLKKRESKVDLFGTEFEMAVKHLVRPQRHTSEIYCVECFASRSTQHELIELGIGESRQNSIHELL